MEHMPELMLLGMVLAVSLAGAYSSATGGVTIIEGTPHTSFDRPLGNKVDFQCTFDAEGGQSCCYAMEDGWRCTTRPGTFGPQPEFRKPRLGAGRGKSVAESPTKPGVYLG